MSSLSSDLSDAPEPAAARSPIPTPEESDVEDASSPATAQATASAPSKLKDLFDEDDEEAADDDDEEVTTKRRKATTPAKNGDEDEDDQLSDAEPPAEDDLFGSDSDAEMADVAPKKSRTLDDEELDSGDDLDGDGRRGYRDDEDDAVEHANLIVSEVSIPVHPIPLSQTDSLYMLKIPPFISVKPQAFEAETYRYADPPDPSITPYNFHTTAVRWRYNPKDKSQIQSNSRIIRWSDGSLSLQIASSLQGIYDLPKNFLSTPPDVPYDNQMDSYTFLAEAVPTSNAIRTIAHIDTELGVTLSSKQPVTDDIKHLLSQRYANSQQRSTATLPALDPKGASRNGTVELSYKMEDPEKARREAEKAEKETDRLRKRLEQQRSRQEETGLGRTSTHSRTYKSRSSAAMTAGDLEDDEESPSSKRNKNFPNRNSQRRQAAEDRAVSKRNREEEYDFDDGFVEPDPDSDDEEELAESEEEEEEEEYVSRKHKSSKDKHHKSPKKSKAHKRRDEEEEDEEEEEEEAAFTDEEEEEKQERAPAREKVVVTKRKSPSAEAVVSDEDEEEDVPTKSAHESKRRRVVVDDSDEE